MLLDAGTATKEDRACSATCSPPKAGERKADFDARLTGLIGALNARRGKVGNLDQLRVAYDAVVNNGCNACHTECRVRN